jgi:hypothetical protein
VDHSAGIDLGSLRCDAAWCHGTDAAEHTLHGWEAEAGRPAGDVAYWDVAALASAPDVGWFAISMATQGRPDLDQRGHARAPPRLPQPRAQSLAASREAAGRLNKQPSQI